MEIGKLRAEGPAPAVPYVYSILRSPESYVQGEKGTESAETCNTVGQSKQETDQAMMLKGNTGYFYCSTE